MADHPSAAAYFCNKIGTRLTRPGDPGRVRLLRVNRPYARQAMDVAALPGMRRHYACSLYVPFLLPSGHGPPRRIIVPGFPHHVTRRGSRREPIFFEDGDQEVYRDPRGRTDLQE